MPGAEGQDVDGEEVFEVKGAGESGVLMPGQ